MKRTIVIAALVLVCVAGAVALVHAQATNPWEQPLTDISTSMIGPVALAGFLIALGAFCLMWCMGYAAVGVAVGRGGGTMRPGPRTTIIPQDASASARRFAWAAPAEAERATTTRGNFPAAGVGAKTEPVGPSRMLRTVESGICGSSPATRVPSASARERARLTTNACVNGARLSVAACVASKSATVMRR